MHQNIASLKQLALCRYSKRPFSPSLRRLRYAHRLNERVSQCATGFLMIGSRPFLAQVQLPNKAALCRQFPRVKYYIHSRCASCYDSPVPAHSLHPPSARSLSPISAGLPKTSSLRRSSSIHTANMSIPSRRGHELDISVRPGHELVHFINDSPTRKSIESVSRCAKLTTNSIPCRAVGEASLTQGRIFGDQSMKLLQAI